MYKGASDKAQSAAHRGKMTDWHNGAQKLTDEERRDNLVDKVKSLEVALINAKNGPKHLWNKATIKELGQQKLDVQKQITAIRPKAKCPDATYHFIRAAEEILPKATFQQVLRMATIRAQNTCVGDDQ